MASQYPTYSNICKTLGYGFRSECMGMTVNEWTGDRVHEQLAMIALAPGTPFVEAVVHNIARLLAEFHCKGAMPEMRSWVRDPTIGTATRRGGSWGPTATSVTRSFSGTTPRADDYHELARQWGLPCDHEGFVDPNQGFGSVPGTNG